MNDIPIKSENFEALVSVIYYLDFINKYLTELAVKTNVVVLLLT